MMLCVCVLRLMLAVPLLVMLLVAMLLGNAGRASTLALHPVLAFWTRLGFRVAFPHDVAGGARHRPGGAALLTSLSFAGRPLLGNRKATAFAGIVDVYRTRILREQAGGGSEEYVPARRVGID